jgi:UDP-2,4-diacetamido-2,4,6-trideoxy-beta-L-altropyranose hydrolase
LIRADANSVIGTGHVMRCLALAQAWQDAGGSVAFACADLPDSLFERLATEQCVVHKIDAPPGSESDVGQTRRLAEAIAPKWVVLDGYDFGSAFQLALRDEEWRLLFIDDDGRHAGYHVDVLLNQNAGAAAVLYGRHMHATRLLLGCQYAMLRREFLRTPRKLGTSQKVSRLLLSLGGGDAKNLTQQFLVAVWPCIPTDCEVDVLIGPANPHITTLMSGTFGSKEAREIAANMKRTTFHVAPPNVPQIMADCDLAITAAGSSVYELGYLGVPMLLAVTADNQRPIAVALDQLGAAVRIDEFHENLTADLPSALEMMISDPERRASCAAKFRELVDGRGAARVVEVLRELSGGQ